MMKKGAKVWCFIVILTVVGLMFSGLIDTTSATSEKTTVSVTDSSPWFTKETHSGYGPWFSYTYEDHDYISTYVGGMSWLDLGGSPSDPDCCARFKPYLSQPGEYEVWAYFYACKDTSEEVPFTVKYDGGTKTKKINQSSSIPAWKEEYLGTWYFKADQDTYVEVTDATGEDFDNEIGLTIGAIKFVKKETVPTPAKILTVPYYNQGNTDWCVPTSMSMIFNYYGKNIYSWDIAEDWDWEREISWWDAHWGTRKSKIVKYFNNKGLATKDISLDDFTDMKDSIGNDIPIFIEVSGLEHAVVIVGYKVIEGSYIVYINDPSKILHQEDLVQGERINIAAEVDWNKLTEYLDFGSYAIAVDGEPSYPKGTIDIRDNEAGFYFHHEGKHHGVYSWRCGKDGGIIWKSEPRLHPLWLDQRDLFKFDQYIANQMEDKQSYSLEIKFAKEGYSRSHFVEIPDVDGRSRKGDIMINSKPLREILYESGDYTITLRLWDEDRTKIYDEIVFPSIEYSPPMPLTKTVKAVHEAIFEPATAEMTILYNRFGQDENGEDVYVISKIDCQSLWFVGYYEVSIESPSGTIWNHKTVTIPPPFNPHGSPLDFGTLYLPSRETSEGIKVHACEWISVKAYGVTEVEMLSIIFTIGEIVMLLPPIPPSPPFLSESAAMYIAPDWIDTSDFPPIVIEKIEILPATLGHLCSPGELRIYDSQGRVTGLLNGEIKQEIPDSAYFNGSFVILSSSASYCYEVEGTETGTYDLGVISIGIEKVNAFGATDIPTTVGAIHQYTIDWAALSQGEKGVTIKMDSNGNGTFEHPIITNNSFHPLIAEFNVSPENPLIGEKVTLDASTSFDLGGGEIKKYRWEFYNAANQDPFHVIEGHDKKIISYSFTSEGIYLVRLTVTDDEGDYSYTESSITIKEPIKEPVFYVPDDYPSIQAAVDAASAGDTIIVRDGTYTENVDIDKSITLKSSSGNPEYTIVDVADFYNPVFSVTADYVKISGFTVTEAPTYGIYLHNADYCDISDNICSHSAFSIYLEGSNSNSISDNICINNKWVGISLNSSTKNSISNNTCSNNGYNGIGLACSTKNSISNNTCSNNGYGGICLECCNQNSISNNLCSNNELGIEICPCWSSNNNCSYPNNCIYLNNFINNDYNVQSHSSTDTWYSPVKLSYTYNGKIHTNYLGNYWSDYTGTDANKNGIGDSPYSIDDRGGDIDQDLYPLITSSEHYFNPPTISTPPTPPPTSTQTPTPRPRLTPPTSTQTPTPRPTLTPPRPTLLHGPH